FYIFLNLIFLLSLTTCSTTEPPPPPDETKPVLTLSFDKKSCTELWIKLTTKDLTLPSELALKQYNPTGDSISQSFILNTKDSLLYIDSLFPNKTYKFLITMQQSNNASNELSVTTMDTTSHNFSYQTFEFGEPLTGNSSRLYDVAIINENNIWAVGEIYVNDSLGQADPIPYNVARWNGIEWELKRINFPVVCGQSNLISYPSRSINVFNDNEIWMSTGGDKIAVIKEGIQINQFCLPSNLNMSINKIWGVDKNNTYIIGNEGKVGYYNGTSWSSVTSGTTLPLTDIYGKDDNEVYAVGINVSEAKGVVLKGNSNGFSVMINSEIMNENELFNKLFGSLDAIWLDENNTLYTAGNLMFQHKNNKWDYVRSLPENYIGGNPGTYYRGFISSIRGNTSNDYVIAGDRNTLKHFNGISWQQIGLPYNPQSQISLIAKQKGNTVVAVGSNGSNAFIILLNR
ncbi:MAG TPA: glucosyl transferase, partial [Ignavibacteriaceae bacterium]|nr:glucosyl transferase [Ignavibacteriaceae bacterium]